MDAGRIVPEVLYHGTRARFDVFSKEGVEPRYDNAQAELGFFFTDDLDYALQYARGRRGRVVAVSLSLANPKVEEPRPSGLSFIDAVELDWGEGDGRAYVEALKTQGHDGIIIRTAGGLTEYVAFDAEQIAVLWNVPAKEASEAAFSNAPSPSF